MLILIAADLVDLSLEVVDDFGGHLVSEDLVQVDPLVSGDGLVGRQLNSFLNLFTRTYVTYDEQLLMTRVISTQCIINFVALKLNYASTRHENSGPWVYAQEVVAYD